MVIDRHDNYHFYLKIYELGFESKSTTYQKLPKPKYNLPMMSVVTTLPSPKLAQFLNYFITHVARDTKVVNKK